MKEYWAEKLRRKLEGHRKSPPEGLWEGISEQMGFTPEPALKPASNSRWIWAAAAVALALVGFFAFYDNDQNSKYEEAVVGQYAPTKPQQGETLTEVNSQVETPVLAANQTMDDNFDLLEKNGMELHESVAQKVQKEQATPQQISSFDDSEDMETQQQPTGNDLEKPSGPPADNNGTAQESDLKKTEHQADIHPNHSSDEWNKQKSTSSSSHKWSIGVNASGGLLAARTSQKTEHNYYYFSAKSFILSNENSFGNNAFCGSVTDYEWEHHLPIRFGLNVNRQLTSRLALQSGINYTYLYSQYSIPLYQNVVSDQELHYLGIPISVSYRLWSLQHFQVYVSGGVMVEKCLNDKPWQLSTNAAAGAEYIFSRQFGFYVEPFMGYYFDDGTSLEHYYKEHPFAPSIEFGIRLHLDE